MRSLAGAIAGLAVAIGGAQAATANVSRATCANPQPMSLPTVLNGAANVCLVTAGTIDSVASKGAGTLTINGVSYANVSSTRMPARVNGNYYLRYTTKRSWAQLQVNGSNSSGAVNYTLALAHGGSGGGSTSLAPGNYSYKAGSAVTIAATPLQGSVFSGLSGSVSASASPLTIAMDGNKSLTAYFATASSDAGLKALASFPIGVAVNAGFENNSIISSGTSAQQQAVVFPNFNQMTAGNIMKMSYLHPQENTFTFGQADEFVGFAGAHAMNVHAHTLIWHADYQVPAFMTNYSGDFAAMLKNHVQTIVSHFRGKVVSWDVVNEALADDGQPTINNILRSSVFSQKMGLAFIDQAFLNARAADPQVDLFYNDYNIEAGGSKTANLLSLIDGMRSRGVLLSGVGFQMHVTIDWPSISAIEASMKAVADRGLKVKISEMDVSMRSAYSSFTTEAAARQQQRYHDIVAAYLRAVPAAQRAGITVWGVWDADSWINQPGLPDWPLLFDGGFQPKPAMQGFKDALLGH
ncbi:endo-1,4-beta-xylanase [Rugamonas sp. A1-17]|nr:endo-1,4-beta-xylanase [Rugamonas sp. A1-17]